MSASDNKDKIDASYFNAMAWETAAGDDDTPGGVSSAPVALPTQFLTQAESHFKERWGVTVAFSLESYLHAVTGRRILLKLRLTLGNLTVILVDDWKIREGLAVTPVQRIHNATEVVVQRPIVRITPERESHRHGSVVPLAISHGFGCLSP